MPYVNKIIAYVNTKKAYEILMDVGYDMKTSQRLIDRARMSCNGKVISEKNAILSGEITLVEYKCEPNGLKPIYEFADFAVFDKPSGVLSHPNGRRCEYSLNDEIWTLFGREASVAHRLDRETSGLIVVAKNKVSQIELKRLFESRAVGKSYLALVSGKVEPEKLAMKGLCKVCKDALYAKDTSSGDIGEFIGLNLKTHLDSKTTNFSDNNDVSQRFLTDINAKNLDKFKKGIAGLESRVRFCIDAPMAIANNYDDVKMRMKICNDSGKSALTEFELLEYFADIDATMLRCYPLTGRQHQIRLHLFHVGHKILGEPLYGLDKSHIIRILDGNLSEKERINLTGANRLLLHADEIWFKFNGVEHKFSSKFNAKAEFCKIATS